jgi:hypothetical protein
MENKHTTLIANPTRRGWFEIVDEFGDHVADYRKGELEVNKDYPLTSEMQRELMFLLLTLEE